MGGLFPEEPDLSHTKCLLDLACGPGGWALEVAFQYRDLEVVGIDINPTMINYAFAQAKAQRLQNVTFEVMDVKQPLNFLDDSFDLVNARLLFGFMDTSSWPALLAECRRILRPGGIVRLSEFEFAVSSSPALQQLQGYLYQALAQQGRSFSVDQHSVGITHMLGKFLIKAGFEQIGHKPFLVNGSYGTKLYYSNYKDAEIAMRLLKPYLVTMGTVEDVAFETLYTHMLADMLQDDFTFLSFGVTAWGVKPSQE
jgi:ubiquinone/menaquinone biosynthesis C-methylase UbiE